MSREEKIKKLRNYCEGRVCTRCPLYTGCGHGNFDNLSDYTLEICCKLIDITENGTDRVEVNKSRNSNVIYFLIEGTCVEDLFNILAVNGYPVQLSTTDTPNKFRVDVLSEVQNES